MLIGRNPPDGLVKNMMKITKTEDGSQDNEPARVQRLS